MPSTAPANAILSSSSDIAGAGKIDAEDVQSASLFVSSRPVRHANVVFFKLRTPPGEEPRWIAEACQLAQRIHDDANGGPVEADFQLRIIPYNSEPSLFGRRIADLGFREC